MSQTENDFLVIFCTAARDEAEALAKTLVEEHLAACVNISPIRVLAHMASYRFFSGFFAMIASVAIVLVSCVQRKCLLIL